MGNWDVPDSDCESKSIFDDLRSQIPPNIVEGLDRYVNEHQPVGDFLTAVLSNDLRESLGRADLSSRRAIFEIVSLLYNYAPGVCWGSKEKVMAWLGGEDKDVE